MTMKLSQLRRRARLHCDVLSNSVSTGSLADTATGAEGSLRV